MSVFLGAIKKDSSITVNDLIGERIYIRGRFPYAGWEKEELMKALYSAFFYDFFDREFYYNFTDSNTDEEYRNAYLKTLNLMYKNIDKTLNKYYKISRSVGEYELVLKDNATKGYMQNWFIKNKKSLSDALKKQYYSYSLRYDIKLDKLIK